MNGLRAMLYLAYFVISLCYFFMPAGWLFGLRAAAFCILCLSILSIVLAYFSYMLVTHTKALPFVPLTF